MADLLAEKTAQATKWSLRAQFLSKMISPVTQMVLAHLLAPEVFGLVAHVNMVISFADIISDAGFQKYLIQHECENEDELPRSANIAFYTNLALSLVLWGMIIAFHSVLPGLFGGEELGTAVILAGMSLPLTAMVSVQTALYQRKLDFRTLFHTRIGSSVVVLLATVPLALAGMGYWSIIIGTIASNLYLAVRLTVASPWKPSWYYSFHELNKIWRFSSWVFMESLSLWVTNWIGVAIVGALMTPRELGLYSNSSALVNYTVSLISGAISPVAYAGLSRLQSDRNRFDSYCFQLQKNLALLVVPLSLGLFTFRELIVAVFLGSQWSDAALFLGLYAAASSVAVVFGHVATNAYKAIGKPLLAFLSQILFLCFFVPALYFGSLSGWHTFSVAVPLARLAGILIGHCFICACIIHLSIRTMFRNLFRIYAVSLCDVLFCSIVIQCLHPGMLAQFFLMAAYVIFYLLTVFAIPELRKAAWELFCRLGWNRAVRRRMSISQALSSYAAHRLLYRLFSPDGTPFVLDGGYSMTARTPYARRTSDVDIKCLGGDIEERTSLFERYVSEKVNDYVSFKIVSKRRLAVRLQNLTTYKYTLSPTVNYIRLANLEVDITVTNVDFGEPEIITPIDRIPIESVPVCPYPVNSMVCSASDKIRSLLEIAEGSTPWRVKDLADLLILAVIGTYDGSELSARTKKAADAEGFRLPKEFGMPKVWKLWYAGWYRRLRYYLLMRQTGLPQRYQNLDAGIELAVRFINPLLDGSAEGKIWNSELLEWQSGEVIPAGEKAYRQEDKKHHDWRIPAGTVLSTLSYDRSRTDHTDMFYAIYEKDDIRHYITMFNKPRVLTNKYSISNKVEHALLVACEDSAVKVFINLFRTDEDFCGFVRDFSRMQSLFEARKILYPGYRQTLAAMMKIHALDASPSEEDLAMAYRIFNYVLPSDGNGNDALLQDLLRQRSKFFAAMIENGYQATLDTNDALYGAFLSSAPIIVFDGKNITPMGAMRAKWSFYPEVYISNALRFIAQKN